MCFCYAHCGIVDKIKQVQQVKNKLLKKFYCKNTYNLVVLNRDYGSLTQYYLFIQY